ncbi:MAG: DUF1186 domain-containing protein, partial [Ghiorsea sp.]|nr:DUF1186 domain-containing protein [Ghiorsea sp.]
MNKASELFERLTSIDEPPIKEEFESMLEHNDELIPLLLSEVDSFIDSPDKIEDAGRQYIRHTLAMFLLASFRVKAAYPKIIQLISMPGNQVINLTGEVFSEALGRILASVYDGDLSRIQSVV